VSQCVTTHYCVATLCVVSIECVLIECVTRVRSRCNTLHLQHTAPHCNYLGDLMIAQRFATHCNIAPATHCNCKTLQRAAPTTQRTTLQLLRRSHDRATLRYTLHRTATHCTCNTLHLQHTATRCSYNTQNHTATTWGDLMIAQRFATHCSALQHIALGTHCICNTLQRCTCNTLQHTATTWAIS